jgi:hypothetical protein
MKALAMTNLFCLLDALGIQTEKRHCGMEEPRKG